MKMYVGVTDDDWFMMLKRAHCDEVNFWKPSGGSFKALNEGDLFLFKLHSPINYIVGGGFFLKFLKLPSSLAWDAFGVANGTKDLFELNSRVYKYKKTNRLSDPNPEIGCIILSATFYFEERDWIPVPEDWSPSIMQGKTYSTDDFVGRRLFQQVEEKLHRYNMSSSDELVIQESGARYGLEQVIKPRIGQGAFRVFVTEAYHRRCAITGEKTLPVLEAAHIKPYSQEGTHETSNGLLLRKDLHTLFDRGYITVTEDCHIEVSKRIKEDYGNGKEYYALHGKELIILPDNMRERPSAQLLRWHNENVYLA